MCIGIYTYTYTCIYVYVVTYIQISYPGPCNAPNSDLLASPLCGMLIASLSCNSAGLWESLELERRRDFQGWSCSLRACS